MWMPETISFKLFIVTVLIFIVFYGYLFKHFGDGPGNIITKEDVVKIELIRNYVNSISDDFMKDVEMLAKDKNLVSWGCGPSSFAIASIIDRKFFDNNLGIDSLYDKEPVELIERFGFIQSNYLVDDKVIEAKSSGEPDEHICGVADEG